MTGRLAFLGLLASALVATSAVAMAQSQGRFAAEAAAAAGASSAPLDLNTATAAQLEELPGIGPNRARAIVALRETLGRFSQVGQLLRVKGIGRAMFRKLRPHVIVVGAPPPAMR